MKKSELKKMLKPLIRECIREVILEESGIISNIVSEVANGLSKTSQPAQVVQEENSREDEERRLEEIKQSKRRLLDSIGSSAYQGVDVFEGTSPAPREGSKHSPLSGRDPGDAGVDLSRLINSPASVIRQLAGTDKKGRQ